MQIKDGYILRRVGKIGIVVGVGEDDEHVLTLNQSGVALWEMLQKDTDLPHLVQKMMEKYDAPEDVLGKDIKNFLRQIKKAGLLEE